MRLVRVFSLFLLCLVAGLVAAAELEVVTLKYRSADQVIPVIRPLIEPGGSVSGLQNQLILRASRENLRQLRKVIESIDTVPRRLLISVRQDLDTANAQRDAELAGSVGSGSEARASARIYESRGASGDRIVQQLQALEGSPAYIHVGKSVPVSTRTVTPTVRGPVVSESVDYRDLATGFEVVPRIVGERVYLDINPRRETPIGGRGASDFQRVGTSASGRLGEWFELGGSARDDTRGDSGVVIGAAGLRKDVRSVWVKVEELK